MSSRLAPPIPTVGQRRSVTPSPGTRSPARVAASARGRSQPWRHLPERCTAHRARSVPVVGDRRCEDSHRLCARTCCHAPDPVTPGATPYACRTSWLVPTGEKVTVGSTGVHTGGHGYDLHVTASVCQDGNASDRGATRDRDPAVPGEESANGRSSRVDRPRQVPGSALGTQTHETLTTRARGLGTSHPRLTS